MDPDSTPGLAPGEITRWSPPRVWHSSKYVMPITSLSPLRQEVSHPHFIDEQTEAQEVSDLC